MASSAGPFVDGSTSFLFRPAPVLAVGLAGDGGIEALAQAWARAREVVGDLRQECARVVERDAAFFAPAPPRIRVVTRLAGDMDRALTEGARAAGAEVAVVSADESGAIAFTSPGVGDTASCSSWKLARTDARSAARAGEALLSQSDILIASWDGRADAAPGSTGALVQEAVERRMPVVLLARKADGEIQIIDDPEVNLLPAVAAELPRVRLAENLDRVLARSFAPPSDRVERRALAAFLSEPRAPRTLRPEYRGLLLLASHRQPATGNAEPALTDRQEWDRAIALAASVSPANAAAVARQQLRYARMEELAAFYGERARSGTVLRYSGPAFGALMIALLAIVAPGWSLAWLGVQGMVITLTIVEATLAVRGRWGERWLDYRSLAERLRCDRFLAPFGIGLGRLEMDAEVADPAWMRWCHRRLLREHWPDGAVTDTEVEAAFRHLAEVEVAGQIRYHEAAATRFRSLERRLRLISAGAVLCIVLSTLALFGLTLLQERPRALGALLMIFLIIMPSVFLASRGLRLEGAFMLAASRSERALAALRQLRQRIPTVPHDFDRLVQASRAAAAAMLRDTVDWRVGVQRSRTPYRSAGE